MGTDIFFVEIMTIVRSNQSNGKSLTHIQKCLVYRLLNIDTVVLNFQKKIPFTKNIKVITRRFVSFIHSTFLNQHWYFSVKTCRQADKSFTVMF